METRFRILKVFPINCYLIEVEGGYLLVDTGMTKETGRLLNLLGKNGVDTSKINYIFLTHHHSDHSGNVKWLLEKTDARLIVHKRAASYLKQGVMREVRGAHLVSKVPAWVYNNFIDYSYTPVPIRDTDLIVDGDNISLRDIGIDGSILYTPGHTTCSISLLLDSGEAFVGDLAVRRFHPGPTFAEDIDEIYMSWKKLIDAGAKLICPAHDSPFTVDVLLKVLDRTSDNNAQGRSA